MQHGSTTVTRGVKIEAVANYVHFFSVFDRDYYDEKEARYYFTYQIRISVDDDFEGDFPKCQLKTRNWIIKMGD